MANLRKRIFLLTSSPGIGKTTLLLKIVEALKAKGYCVGGMISREVREGGTRVGFEILDLVTNKRGWLAQVSQKTGPQVGKYRVNLEDLNNVGVAAIISAVRSCDVVAVDEIGPMELFSEKFKQAVMDAVESGKLVIGVIHWRAKDKLIEMVKNREDAETFTVTYENRGKLYQHILEKIEGYAI